MIAMIFEFWFDPDAPDVFDEYLGVSDQMRAALAGAPGFAGVERFQSCAEPNKYVAIGFFDDEEAVTAWRNHPAHRTAQVLGRTRFFTDYRLRMAQVVRDYGPSDRAQAPADSVAVEARADGPRRA
jgi:heme-degrading monooxygenase HmoA